MTERLYLSGPMTGMPDWNYPAFNDAAENLRVVGGYEVLNPAELDPEGAEPHELSWVDCINRDLEAMYRFKPDGIVFLPGWANSVGARIEAGLAYVMGASAYIYNPNYERLTQILWDSVMDYLPHDPDSLLERVQEGRPALHRKPLSEEELAAYAPSQPTETRVVDPNTGGMKGSKAQQMSHIPPDFLMALSEVYTFGAGKYPDKEPGRPNWSLGYNWSLSYNAMQRHIHAFQRGEWADPESGLPHLAHAGWHLATLYTYHQEGLGTDDRPKYYNREG